MNCSQVGCDGPPCFRYTWPGKDEQRICAIHAIKLQQVAAAMGLHMQMIPLEVADFLKREASEARYIPRGVFKP